MKDTLFHLYRHTPYGRESLRQSAYFCRTFHPLQMAVYIPKFPQYLMYFDREVVTINLDTAYTHSPKAAQAYVSQLLKKEQVDFLFYEPNDFTANSLPNILTTASYMTFPRRISEWTYPLGLGLVDSGVRRIVKNASFPIFLPSPTYTEWKSVTALYDGTHLGCHAIQTAFHIAERTGFPLSLFTQRKRYPLHEYEQKLHECGLWEKIHKEKVAWSIHEQDEWDESLIQVPSDSLVVMGSTGHRSLKEILFGNDMEKIQRILPNPILAFGTHYIPPHHDAMDRQEIR